MLVKTRFSLTNIWQIEAYNLDVNRMISGKLQLIRAKDELSNELQQMGMDTYELWGGSTYFLPFKLAML